MAQKESTLTDVVLAIESLYDALDEVRQSVERMNGDVTSKLDSIEGQIVLRG